MRLAGHVVECEPLQAKAVEREEDAKHKWIKTLRERTASLKRVVSLKKSQSTSPLKDLSAVVMPHTPHPHDGGKTVAKPRGSSTPGDANRVDAVFKQLPGELLALTPEERRILVRSTQKLLFVTDFMALVEYTEVIIPLNFNLYILIVSSMPNRQYHDFLQGLTRAHPGRQIGNIFLYASLELASLILMAVLLWHKLRLSLLHQIAFVFETRQASIQAKLLRWVTDVMQNAIRQFGVDYSFKFAWLDT